MNSHLTLCWSVKGGQGVTVTTALLALALHADGTGVDLVDHTGGDLAAALTTPPSNRHANTLQHAINDAIAVTPHIRLLSFDADNPRLQLDLLDHIAQADREHRHVLIDAGQSSTWTPGGTLHHLSTIAARSYLITRTCYLALRRAITVTAPQPTGVIVVTEPGRALRGHDIENALRLPVAAELTIDLAIARAADAGLLSIRQPTSAHALRNLAWF